MKSLTAFSAWMYAAAIVLIFVSVWTVLGDRPPVGWTTKAKVIYVVDGDTVDVEIRRVIRIRLLDCWAPESRTRDLDEKKRGLESKARMKELVDGKEVTVHIPTRSSGNIGKILTMNRVLGYVWIGDESVSQVMVDEGLATAEKE